MVKALRPCCLILVVGIGWALEYWESSSAQIGHLFFISYLIGILTKKLNATLLSALTVCSMYRQAPYLWDTGPVKSRNCKSFGAIAIVTRIAFKDLGCWCGRSSVGQTFWFFLLPRKTDDYTDMILFHFSKSSFACRPFLTSLSSCDSGFGVFYF